MNNIHWPLINGHPGLEGESNICSMVFCAAFFSQSNNTYTK